MQKLEEEKGMTEEGDGWMASPARARGLSQLWELAYGHGRPGVLQPTGLQRVGQDWRQKLSLD